MVVAVFPLAKIGILLLKQLSKPVANIIKNEAKKHPLARKHVIVPIGRAYNWIENKTLRAVTGKQELEHVSDEEAVELGANAVGEMVLFGILCLILLAEFNRQGDKKAVKEKTKMEEIENLQEVVLELNNEVVQLKKMVEDVKRVVENPPDIFDLEEQRHVQINDHNFWDILISEKHKSHKKLNFDKNSPSI